ncbi:hypothetical protein SAMN02745218_02474, partial [Desulfofundulus australicus DSM 11792]
MVVRGSPVELQNPDVSRFGILTAGRVITGAPAGQKISGLPGSRYVVANTAQEKNLCANCCTRLPCRVRIET